MFKEPWVIALSVVAIVYSTSYLLVWFEVAPNHDGGEVVSQMSGD
jgi:hypothetical protein